MAEYIEREQTIKAVVSAMPKALGHGISAIAMVEIVDVIEELPTADVVEVRRGEWKGKPIAGYSNIRCSVCNAVFLSQTGNWQYCPNCGAKNGDSG